MFNKRSLDETINMVEKAFSLALAAEAKGDHVGAERWLMKAIALEAAAFA